MLHFFLNALATIDDDSFLLGLDYSHDPRTVIIIQKREGLCRVGSLTAETGHTGRSTLLSRYQ